MNRKQRKKELRRLIQEQAEDEASDYIVKDPREKNCSELKISGMDIFEAENSEKR